MDIREWALLAFTILGQIAAGMLIVTLVVRALAVQKAGVEETDRFADAPLYAVVPVMVIALLASLLHLGSPLNITKAVPNLGTSWLSREVVIAVTFMILAAVYTFLQWRKVGGSGLRTLIGWIAGLVGLIMVYAMGRVYMIRTQPAWNTSSTLVSFFTTCLLLGVVAVAAVLVANHARLRGQKSGNAEKQSELLRSVLQVLALAAIILLGIEFVALPVYLAFLSTQGTAALGSLKMIAGSFGGTLVLRLLLVFLGAGVLAVYQYRDALVGRENRLAALTYGAFILVLASEVIGRVIFYASRLRIGL